MGMILGPKVKGKGHRVENVWALSSELIGRVMFTFTLMIVFRLDALALSVIATATWLAGWLGGCLSQPVLYQND